MPELPDITAYVEALEERVLDQPLAKVRVASPFVVRSFDPPLRALEGHRVAAIRRMGKRIVFAFSDELFLVVHLMVAGRLRYEAPGKAIAKKVGLAAFDFPEASLILTEASKKKRASIVAVRGQAALEAIDPGGLEVIGASRDDFAAALVQENHTLKRTLTDPHVFSGIGNAYSDEILHRARLSPVKWTQRLSDEEITRLHAATQAVLIEWIERLRAERAGAFPEKVTAFRPEMAVHGKYRAPCPVCGGKVMRIVRGESEINYCPGCQTGGKLLADRALSRLLRGDWPKTLEELEERKARLGQAAAPAPRSGLEPEPPEPAAKPTRTKGPVASPAKPAKRGARAPKPLILFAPGAGAPSTSSWMTTWAERLAAIGRVVRFDYPYVLAGKKRPDQQDRLIAAHVAALVGALEGHRGPVILAGKSMGSRIGCHVALEQRVAALVCFGYPLVSAGKRKALRDEVLLALDTPILFVQGTRDPLCPLDQLEAVRGRMTAPSERYLVDSGDHSLVATKTWLRAHGETQDEVDARTALEVASFVRGVLGSGR